MPRSGVVRVMKPLVGISLMVTAYVKTTGLCEVLKLVPAITGGSCNVGTPCKGAVVELYRAAAMRSKEGSWNTVSGPDEEAGPIPTKANGLIRPRCAGRPVFNDTPDETSVNATTESEKPTGEMVG